MKNQWTNFFFGSVSVHVSGIGIERLLNDSLRNSISVWSVKRHGDDTVSFFIKLKDVHAFRRIIRGHECTCRFQQRKGFPFLLKKTGRNSGFAIGFAAFLCLIFLLSNMVWGIKIEGAVPETEHRIQKELKAMDIKPGKLQFLVKNPDEIQKQLTDRIGQITWVGVELRGTTYHLKVVEKNQPQQEKPLGPRNIVAKKKAVITRMFVEEGKPLVNIHDTVQKGQVLVSGLIGNEGAGKLIPAKAEIMGETWYKSTIFVPLSTTFQVFSGNDITMYYLSAAARDLKFWGYRQELPGQFELEEEVRPFRFLKWELPVSFKSRVYRERETVQRKYSNNEAALAGIQTGKAQILQKIGDGAEIIGEKVLHQSVENGKVKLVVLYQVNENIVQTTPIVQGD
ncbi:sporulation protein YqfD [Bacillus lacus]|uniref:Sporulation protein YqfD n=1 Tax=Metabacillus lacus TaxID=1983721 RepID=A0A7X2IY74_9BACI|nr:sporulation protein YqfD [Metabacillus lacus]MRX71308.1 sporulation protein YqfD [Metabacillus lacus]